jgi:hypothetical protein
MAKKGEKKVGTSMVAPQPSGTEGLLPVEELAAHRGLQPWFLAALRRAAGWSPGKQVSAGEFEAALEKFNRRPQGGGKI